MAIWSGDYRFRQAAAQLSRSTVFIPQTEKRVNARDYFTCPPPPDELFQRFIERASAIKCGGTKSEILSMTMYHSAAIRVRRNRSESISNGQSSENKSTKLLPPSGEPPVSCLLSFGRFTTQHKEREKERGREEVKSRIMSSNYESIGKILSFDLCQWYGVPMAACRARGTIRCIGFAHIHIH